MSYRVFDRMFRVLVAVALLVLAGCKLQINVGPGGMVVSTDGAYVCRAGQTCTIDVVDLFFDETFIAVPGPGYYFGQWKEGDQALCAGSSEPCHLSTDAFEDLPALETLLMSDEVFSLEPLFVWHFTKPEKVLEVSPKCEGVVLPDVGCIEYCPD